MKKLATLVSLAAALATTGALANTSDILNVQGTIDEFCELQVTPQSGFEFDNQWHVVGQIGVSCNNGNGTANVTYEAQSNGFVHTNGLDFISYEARNQGSIPSGPVTIPPNGGPHTISQAAGAYPAFASTNLEYKGITNGSELAGDYTAVMEITVSP